MRYTSTIAVLLAVAVAGIGCRQPVAGDEKDVVGVWRIEELTRKDGSRLDEDGTSPSLLIFTEHHYSMVWASRLESQRAFAERWNPTDAEKIERYDSFVVNSGIYEIEDSTLTAYPIVARVPEFMGGALVCEYHVHQNTMRLEMVDEYSYDGVRAPWVERGDGLVLTLARIDREE